MNTILSGIGIIICLFSFSISSYAQTKDSIIIEKPEVPKASAPFPDSIFRFNVKKTNPKRAGLYSACIPGLGQVYNKQYWKAGLVYAGSAVITGFIISNYKQYTKYNKVYIGMIDNNPDTPDTYLDYTVDDVNLLRKGYRQYLEYSVLAATLGYMLNILDAFIASHLKSFDTGKDISFHTSPYHNSQNQTGLCVSFSLK